MDKFFAEKTIDPIIAATRAIVVCEEAYTRRLVGDVLYGMGVGEVALFDHSRWALKSMAQFRPTLMVANWDAPSHDGLELAKLVRSAVKTPSSRIPDPTIPIILVGSQQWRRDVNEAERAGVNEYLVKPFSIEDLTRRVTHLLLRPKPFIISAKYVGPDRRIKNQTMLIERRVEDNPPGQLEIIQPLDPLAEFRAGLAQRIETLGGYLPTKGQIAANRFITLLRAVQMLEYDAREVGDEPIRRVAHSLNHYIAGAGHQFQCEIARAHLAAFDQFQSLPSSQSQQDKTPPVSAAQALPHRAGAVSR